MVGLTIRLMGNPEITIDQRPLSFRTREELAILIYLLVERGMHGRESLMALLWPDRPAKKATNTLRGILSRLRNALQPAGQFILSQAGNIGFDFEGAFDLDLDWLATGVLPETPPELLNAIQDLDRGEFLATLSDLERRCGNLPEAEMLIEQAHEVIGYIAENAGSNALRDSFLAQPAVARVVAEI